ncbi:MAG: energy transducer TonB, partial [Proteobacteria bacterium]
NNERISVDFYKIDIHNVFRLFRQITDLNIIVDESVNGSITLALTDVPWDFALDIILNLTDLKKEERYNTIVIYPKNKDFQWPQRAADNLSLDVDETMVQEEALIIEQSTNLPVEIMKAKEMLVSAHKLEKSENFEDAVALYEKAAALWPENSKIANKVANIYLGRLNQSAKAYYFARKALEKNPADTKSALYCAIASANMDRISEAAEYFAQSISDNPPMKEALISYAAFSEKNNQTDIALKLLNTFSDTYGDTVHTMVSKARILDKTGKREEATAQYKALLSSGFIMRPDLKNYVKGRVQAGNF